MDRVVFFTSKLILPYIHRLRKPFITCKVRFLCNQRVNPALGTETPEWWAAYNKIKHNLDLSTRRVKYHLVIESIGALFIVLIYAEPDMTVLKNNGYLKSVNGKTVVKTRLFQCQI